MNFAGRFFHGIDPKNRVFVPAEFREDLGENFYIYKSPEKCLCLYNQERWDELVELIKNRTTSNDERNIKRKFFSRVAPCKMDKQGRITISAEFLEFASIENEVAFAGMGNCVELWNVDAWKQIEASDDDDDLEGIMF